jgi:hypothetical protein
MRIEGIMMIRNITGRPFFRFGLLQSIGALLLGALLLFPSASALASKAPAGLDSETHFISPQFFFELQWSAPWKTDPSLVESVQGSYDRIVVVGPDGALQSLLYFGTGIDDAMKQQIDARVQAYDNVQVVGTSEGETELGLPYLGATLTYEVTDDSGTVQLMEYIEVSPAYTIDLDHAILVVSVAATPDTLASMFESAQKTFVYNQESMGALFSGQPSVDGVEGTNRPKSNPTGSEEEYLATLNTEFQALNDSINRFAAVINDPNAGDQASVDELTKILNSWVDAYNYAQSLTPPSGYEQVHAAYLDFTGLLAGAAEDLFNGDLESAVAKLQQAQESAKSMTVLLEQPTGTDVLGRKSG